MARKALLVNSSYMRRVWTIMEAVVATQLQIFPLKGFSASESDPGNGNLYLKMMHIMNLSVL